MSDHTLDPEQIRNIPMDRTQPLNGLTEEQTRALGLDPTEVEAGRLAHLEWEQAQQLTSDAHLVLAAQEAVEVGEMTRAQAALSLRESGRKTAHDLFVREWYDAEQAEKAEYNADEFIFSDAATYLQQIGQLDAAETAKAAEEAAAAQAAEDARLAEQIKAKLDATVPANHPLRAGIETAVVMKLTEDGAASLDEHGQNQLIRGAVQKTAVLDSALESIRQQAEHEWRIRRATLSKTGALMTQADIDAAKEHYINDRMQQLGDSKIINHDDLKAPPTAEDEKQKYLDRIGGRNERSTSLHEAVSAIESRGREAEAARRAGASTFGSAADRERYEEAKRRAEANAYVASSTPEQPAVVSRNPNRPDLPPDWPDELGPVWL